MKFVLFFTFCIKFRVKPWRLMFGHYGKLWHMGINFFKKNAFKFLPYILRFIIAKFVDPVYITEITIKIFPTCIFSRPTSFLQKSCGKG